MTAPYMVAPRSRTCQMPRTMRIASPLMAAAPSILAASPVFRLVVYASFGARRGSHRLIS
jgi:hypothetical protein